MRKDQQILAERAKLKEVNSEYNCINDELKKKDQGRHSLLERIGDLELELREREDEIKQLSKDTSIAIKKCEIRLDAEKEEHELSRKKLREREEHISNLKLELARYN